LREKVDQGVAKANHFPLLLHVDEIINSGAELNVPWQAFERVSAR